MREPVSQSGGKVEELVDAATRGEKYALAQLISGLEKPGTQQYRRTLFELIEQKTGGRRAVTIGFTGTPGAGKSSLIAALAKRFLKNDAHKTLGILAVDPSSSISGGSILGDRTRMQVPAREQRIYFRSQPSLLELGGVNPYTYHVVRLLRSFFDYLFIETVGIGQNEIEIVKLADYSFLILQPMAGDQIQFMKSGIMETPDAFILNKYDQTGPADESYHRLVNTLDFLRGISKDQELPPIFKTSAVSGLGVDSLLEFIKNIEQHIDADTERQLQFQKWVKNEFGNHGLRKLKTLGLNYAHSFEDLEEELHRSLGLQ